MEKIKDIIDFFSKLDGDYPIPRILFLPDVEISSIQYYVLNWEKRTNSGYDNSVRCQFLQNWDTLRVAIDVCFNDKYDAKYGLTLEECAPVLNDFLCKLYENK